MAWFKIDDSLATHPKVLMAGPEPMALWVLAGSWSGRHETDGYVPAYVLPSVAPGIDCEALAARLVDSGLWEPCERDGRDGYQFHDWTDYNPSKVRLDAKRAATADRQQRWRDNQSRNAVTNASGNGVSNDAGNGVANTAPVPSRPDPTPSEGARADEPATVASGDRGRAQARGQSTTKGTRIPDDFSVSDELVEWARERTPGVDGRAETEKFVNYWSAKSGKDATKVDWSATWRNWMLRAQEAKGPVRTSGGKPSREGRPWTPPAPPDHIAEDTQAYMAYMRDITAKWKRGEVDDLGNPVAA